jgi:hypothetical protein
VHQASVMSTVLPLVHVPVVADHTPKVGTPHVVLGLPTHPVLHVALHTVLVVLLAGQLYTPLRGFAGVAVHTAAVGSGSTVQIQPRWLADSQKQDFA